jgi:hypothetical protein
MPKTGWSIFITAALGAFFLCAPARAGEDGQANALLVVPSATMVFDKDFQDFLNKNGVKLLQSYPPSVFVGYIPKPLDKELGEKYGAAVYRDRVDDWGSFARYGEKAVFAVTEWNKRFVEDPASAPMVISSSVKRAGRKDEVIDLDWNEVMKASSYRLQISTDPYFGGAALDTVLARNSFRVVKAFWPDGVYYWRVAGLLKLNNGRVRAGGFSEAYSYAVSKPVRGDGAAPGRPVLKNAAVKRALTWAPAGGARYYRVQLSATADFSATAVDVFTDTCSLRLSGLPLKREIPYYVRAKASDGVSAGDWSEAAEVTLEPQ